MMTNWLLRFTKFNSANSLDIKKNDTLHFINAISVYTYIRTYIFFPNISNLSAKEYIYYNMLVWIFLYCSVEPINAQRSVYRTLCSYITRILMFLVWCSVFSVSFLTPSVCTNVDLKSLIFQTYSMFLYNITD